jgi:hypothetical protein
MKATALSVVMRGLDPRIHLSAKRLSRKESWIAGSSPAMTGRG